MTDILTFLYAAVAIVGGVAYWPQIRALINDDSGAEAISIFTWSVWVIDMIIVSLYAIFVNGDKFFIFCSLINTVGCVVVLGLALRNRLRYV